MIKKEGSKAIITRVKEVRGAIEPPADKSISHRAAIAASLVEGKVEVDNFLLSEDTLATVDCLRKLGVDIEVDEEGRCLIVESAGAGSFSEPQSVLDAKNSATAMRMLSGVVSAFPFFTVLTGDNSLVRRPMKRIIEPLSLMGATILSRKGGFPPLAIKGGFLKGIEYRLKVPSAQVKSAILFAGMLAESGKTVVIEELKSRDHTERLLKVMGAPVKIEGKRIEISPFRNLQAEKISVPSDPSSAAFFVAAGVLADEGEVIIRNCCLNPTRTGFIKTLQESGANIQFAGYSLIGAEPIGDIIVKPSPELKPLRVEPDEVPSLVDEIPVLRVVAAFTEGVSVFSGIEELRYKETDRINAVAENLTRMGVRVEASADRLKIYGSRKLTGDLIKTFNDHRIAMAFSIAGLFAEGETVIDNADCVAVSYPDFFNDLSSLIK